MKFLKHLFAICLAIISLTSLSFADQKEDLEPGLYELKNDVYHEQEIGQNMARTYLNEDMELEVLENDDYRYTIEFSGIEYMKDHRILVDGKETDIDIVEENESTMKIKFDTDSLDSKIETKIYVDAMERDVEFDIIPDFEALNLVEKYDVVEEVEEIETVSEEENTEEVKSEKNTSSESGENISTEKEASTFDKYKVPVVTVVLAAIIAGVGFKIKRKK